MATTLDLNPLDRGDTWDHVFNFVDTDGNAVDITGYKFWMTFKINPEEDDADITTESGVQVSTTSNDANSLLGILTLRFEAEATVDLLPGTYQYDLQMKSGTAVTTLLRGKAKVIADITRSLT